MMESSPCQTCRARHLDCDKTLPACQVCTEADRTCVPAFNVRFKKHKTNSEMSVRRGGRPKFSSNQAWVETPRELSFVNETPVKRQKTLSAECLSDADEVDREHAQLTPLSDFNTLSSQEATGVEDEALLDAYQSPLRIDQLLNDQQQTTSPANRTSFPSSMESPQSLYLDPLKATIIDRRGAELLHYFRTNIGHAWFDVTDGDFTTEALRLAPTCPILLYSLLAVSCIHKSRISTDPRSAEECACEADEYHGKCVTLLLPMLGDRWAITDGSFLASSTLLRFYEELSAPVHGRDDGHDTRHLLGGYACVEESHKQSLPWTGLRRAALWIHQRQDAFNAILNQRTPKTPVDDLGIDRSCSSADDCVWAKRATCLNAEVVGFCFGDDVSSLQRFRLINDRLEEWYRCKPNTFTPVLYEDRDVSRGQHFPHVPMLSAPCVVGVTYHYFSILLMTVHDPRTPKIGPNYLEAQRKISDLVLCYVRLLCGLACSNPVPPARVVTCLAISQFGAWIIDPGEQEAVISVLNMAEREDAWPTLEIENTLIAQWNKGS